MLLAMFDACTTSNIGLFFLFSLLVLGHTIKKLGSNATVKTVAKTAARNYVKKRWGM